MGLTHSISHYFWLASLLVYKHILLYILSSIVKFITKNSILVITRHHDFSIICMFFPKINYINTQHKSKKAAICV